MYQAAREEIGEKVARGHGGFAAIRPRRSPNAEVKSRPGRTPPSESTTIVEAHATEIHQTEQQLAKHMVKRAPRDSTPPTGGQAPGWVYWIPPGSNIEQVAEADYLESWRCGRVTKERRSLKDPCR